MSIFGISDLHLSFGSDKPMDVFGGWNNYTDRIRANWNRLVHPEDTVVLPGDLSWGLKLSQTAEDFRFLSSLPGKKVIIKGNHDLWWGTAKKMKEFLDENGFDDIEIIFNNCAVAEGYAIAGTRGWFYNSNGNDKVLLREAGRLEASLNAAESTGLPVLVFLHYPPVYKDYVCNEILDVLKRHKVNRIYCGHIHGVGNNYFISEHDWLSLKLISCDCIDFTPFLIV